MCFYGLTMVASDIGDNVFLNFILVLGIGELLLEFCPQEDACVIPVPK